MADEISIKFKWLFTALTLLGALLYAFVALGREDITFNWLIFIGVPLSAVLLEAIIYLIIDFVDRNPQLQEAFKDG